MTGYSGYCLQYHVKILQKIWWLVDHPAAINVTCRKIKRTFCLFPILNKIYQLSKIFYTNICKRNFIRNMIQVKVKIQFILLIKHFSGRLNLQKPYPRLHWFLFCSNSLFGKRLILCLKKTVHTNQKTYCNKSINRKRTKILILY